MAEAFQFNFFRSSEPGAAAQSDEDASAGSSDAAEVIKDQAEQVLDQRTTVELNNGISLVKGRVTSVEAAAMLSQPELQASDLVPNKYEGGFKLWEGAIDLCNYMIQQHQFTPERLFSKQPTSSLQGKKVLELGCGHGLPGILCLLAGAAVHFQDFNKQVLTHLTQPNVQANLAQLPQDAVRHGCRYFSGDWAAVGQLLSAQGMGGYYDIILTAETIYNEESQQRLLSCIKQVLEPPHGVVYVAAKSFYFGVGGSTASFEELVKADGVLECSQVWKVEDGCSNKREILKLNFPESITPYFL